MESGKGAKIGIKCADMEKNSVQIRRTKMKKILILVCVLLFVVTFVFAMPPQNVSWKKHPNLRAAQMFIDKAFAKISAAQVANEFDMDGHAAKAKDLLAQANAEIKMAAQAANQNAK